MWLTLEWPLGTPEPTAGQEAGEPPVALMPGTSTVEWTRNPTVKEDNAGGLTSLRPGISFTPIHPSHLPSLPKPGIELPPSARARQAPAPDDLQVSFTFLPPCVEAAALSSQI